MNRTHIQWCDFSANPLKFREADGHVVWGCVHASPGCQHCYAETLATRFRRGGPFNVPTMAGLRPFLDEQELGRMLTYKPASGKRVFVGDMTDIFGEWVPDELLDRLFDVFALRTDVTWQVLTKRADRMQRYLSGPRSLVWPLSNCWIGVSCEDQQRADERIPLLLQTPAAVRFVSAEPLLAGIDIAKHRPGALGLHWLIAGGESGAGARPSHVWWYRNLLGQCRDAGIAFFLKQLGAHLRGDHAGFVVNRYEMPDGSWRPLPVIVTPGRKTWCAETRAQAIGFSLYDRKGGDMAEWPEDLRVRQWPKVRA